MKPTRPSQNRAQRGQNLVLMALTMLFLVVMVLGSLSLSTRIKERMEAQMLADVAAYNEAAVTARAYNSIALLNRVQVAQMASLAAVEAMVSHAAFYKDSLRAYSASVSGLYGPPLYCNNSPVSATLSNVGNELNRLRSGWARNELPTGAQARAIQQAAVAVGRDQADIWDWYRGRLLGLGNQDPIAVSTVRKTVSDGLYGPEIRVVPLRGEADITRREVAKSTGGAPKSEDYLDMAHAAMGARAPWVAEHGRELAGASFATGYLPLALKLHLSNRLNSFSSGPISADLTMTGTTYFAESRFVVTHGNPPMTGVNALVSETHGFVGAQWPGRPNPNQCPRYGGPNGVNTWLRGTARQDDRDEHVHGDADARAATTMHTLIQCRPGDCPGIWPIFLPYNRGVVEDERDNAGVPKTMVLVERDYDKRAFKDPFAIKFKMGLGAGAQEVDLAGTVGDRQVALATGLTYYHRGRGHWREPPNFMNPWWNATLVSPDIDREGRRAKDALTVIEAGGVGGGALRQLRANGFEGWQ